ncbi:MAG TPA: DUF1223 domain-containing protein [Reyranellaceae bacterium]|nr:DUF1223 domain-containing protein [Reyranellaceae bacterium]
MDSPSLSRRSVLLGGAAVAAMPAAAQAGDKQGPWAVELFTSQGCNSCPPADANLGELARRADIVALSYHVNYWDYIGWKDPFASQETTDRQRAYARALKQRYVYTPEMVVDGIGHDAGRELGPIRKLLAEAQRRSPKRATPELARDVKGPLTVKLAGFALDNDKADITLAVYDRRHLTKVLSGENGGRKLENFNVVRRLELIDQWDGAPKSWSVPGDSFGPGQGVAVLVQRANHGPMIGCNKLEFAVSN